MVPLKPAITSIRPLRFASGCLVIGAFLSLFCVPGFSSGGQTAGEAKLKMEDNLALGLRNSAAPLMAYLRKNDYDNVGVLKFLIKVGGRYASFDVGRLNDFLATRLENVLILANNEADPIGITRDAGAVAAKKTTGEQKAKASFIQPKDRSHLFRYDYPLAWGGKSAKVDAFLTGFVKINVEDKNRSVEVYLCAFHKKDPENLEVVHRFRTKLETNSLAEAGIGFALTKRALKNNNSIAHVNIDPMVQLGTDPILPVDKAFHDVLDFRILYDGVEIESPQRHPDGTLHCRPPKKGQKVHFALKSSERIGLLLFVNGVNTLMMDKYTDGRSLETYARWILEPNQEYLIKGFYPSFEKARPFVVTPEAEADLGDLGPTKNWGRIEMHIFREGVPVEQESDTSSGNLNLGGKPDPEASLADVKKKLREKLFLKVIKQGILTPGEAKDDLVQKAKFVGTLSLHRTITYHQIGKVDTP